MRFVGTYRRRSYGLRDGSEVWHSRGVKSNKALHLLGRTGIALVIDKWYGNVVTVASRITVRGIGRNGDHDPSHRPTLRRRSVRK